MEKGIGTSHGDGAAWRSRAGGGGEGEGAADAPWPPPPWPRGLRQRRRARREEGAGREFFFATVKREDERGERFFNRGLRVGFEKQ